MKIPPQNIAKSFAQSSLTYESNAIAQKQIAERLFNISEDKLSTSSNILELGCGSGFLSKKLIEKNNIEHLFFNDLTKHQNFNNIPSTHFLLGDAETISYPTPIDFIISSSTIQWFKDTPSFLQKCANALSEYGQIIFSTFGVENFSEIRKLSGNGLKYFSTKEWKTMLKKCFTEIIISEEKIPLFFSSAKEMLKHLKNTGVNAGNRNYKTRSQIQKFLNEYDEKFKTNNGVQLTYHAIYIIAKKKHQV